MGERREHNQRTYTLRFVANRAQMDKLNQILSKCEKGVASRMTKSETLSAILSDTLNRRRVEHLVGVVNAAADEARESIAAEKRRIEKARLIKTKLAIAAREREIEAEERKAAERLSS